MKKNWVLSQESFDLLLEWLSPDREQAGQRYEEIRTRLIKIYTNRGCWEADELADETINRVADKLGEVKDSYTGDPALFFYGFVNNIHLEYLRRKPAPVPPSMPPMSEEDEDRFRCLEDCFAKLDSETRELVTQYYQGEKTAKINHRRDLADQMGIAPNALRIRAFRARATLLKCIERCLARRNSEIS